MSVGGELPHRQFWRRLPGQARTQGGDGRQGKAEAGWESDCDWTINSAGNADIAARGNLKAGTDLRWNVTSTATRADVAEYMVKILDDPATYRKAITLQLGSAANGRMPVWWNIVHGRQNYGSSRTSLSEFLNGPNEGAANPNDTGFPPAVGGAPFWLEASNRRSDKPVCSKAN